MLYDLRWNVVLHHKGELFGIIGILDMNIPINHENDFTSWDEFNSSMENLWTRKQKRYNLKYSRNDLWNKILTDWFIRKLHEHIQSKIF